MSWATHHDGPPHPRREQVRNTDKTLLSSTLYQDLTIIIFFSNITLDSSRCIDILELSERMDLLKFHYHTLKLYGSVCALGNNRVAHALCSHVDESQLFYAIQNTYLPGPIRSGFYDLLISMHLESAKRGRLGTNREFIIPMTDETRSITLYTDKSCALPGVGLTTCLRPKLHFSSVGFVGTNQDIYTLSPVIPLQVSFNLCLHYFWSFHNEWWQSVYPVRLVMINHQ